MSEIKISNWQGKVKILMQEQKIKQRVLAEKCGISEVTLSRYLKGERSARVETIIQIAEVLNVSLDFLLGEDFSSVSSFDELRKQIMLNKKNLNSSQKLQLISLLL